MMIIEPIPRVPLEQRLHCANKRVAPALNHVELSEPDALGVQTVYRDKYAADMLPRAVKRMGGALPKTLSDAVGWKLKVKVPGMPNAR
jgi:hypothetical protein